MYCKQYEKFELGQLEESVFKQHVQECDYCRQQTLADEELLQSVSALSGETQIPDLWPQIENQLPQKTSGFKFPEIPTYFFKLAATLLIAVSMIVFFRHTPEPDPGRILSSSALQEVQKKEQKYIESIERLEGMARVKMESLDINLSLLYRDKLDTIDSQIERCQDALQENPANTHIRRYLLAALDDKKQTLREILK